ncbi:MAG: MopE-related protein, partial [Myxococcota bacterium]
MRALPLLLLLTACGNGSIKLGADTGPAPGDDVDGDGFAALDKGGQDCDDNDDAVFPGATEVWYDDVDQDCDGASDHDQDGDGADRAPVGTDCDDADSTVFGGAAEIRDLADQDCDGLVDEDFVAAGDVVVSEVMHHPLAASDADGEWFELTNVSDVAIDIVGWTIAADDGDAVTIEGSLVLEAGGVVVLGANGDTGRNGGVALDYVYDRASLSLSSDDTLFLGAGATTVFDVEW